MVKQCSPFVLSGVVDSSFKWPYRGSGQSAQADQTEHVWSCEVRSAQASRAASSRKEPADPSHKDGSRSPTTKGACQEAESRRKSFKLSADHVSRKLGCLSTFSGLPAAHDEADIAQQALLAISLRKLFPEASHLRALHLARRLRLLQETAQGHLEIGIV